MAVTSSAAQVSRAKKESFSYGFSMFRLLRNYNIPPVEQMMRPVMVRAPVGQVAHACKKHIGWQSQVREAEETEKAKHSVWICHVPETKSGLNEDVLNLLRTFILWPRQGGWKGGERWRGGHKRAPFCLKTGFISHFNNSFNMYTNAKWAKFYQKFLEGSCGCIRYFRLKNRIFYRYEVLMLRITA